MLHEQLTENMPQIKRFESELFNLNRQLTKVTLTGKISSLNEAETLLLHMCKFLSNPDTISENIRTL
jgi:hypothetical protein